MLSETKSRFAGKKTICLFCFVSSILFSQQQERFIIGAEHVSAMSEFWGCQLPHNSTFWNYVEEFGLNYVGLKYFQKYPPNIGVFEKSEILAELDSANNRNLKVFLFNGFDHYEGKPQINPRRWVYQVEKVLGNTLNDFSNVPTGDPLFDDDPNLNLRALTHWNLAPPEEGTPNYLQLRPGEHSYGLVASNLREQNLQPDGQKYFVKIKMRLPDAVTYEDVSVCTVKVHYNKQAEVIGEVHANQFSDNNWKEIQAICFMKTAKGPIDCGPNGSSAHPDSIATKLKPNYILKKGITSTDYDYQIYWNKTPQGYQHYKIDIDYIAVDDTNAHRLYAGNFDDRIDDAVCVEYREHPAVLNFQAHDEVRIPDLFPVRYINHEMQSYISKQTPVSYHYFSGNPANPSPVTKRFLWETDMQVLISNIYPFWFDGTMYPVAPEYTKYIQTKFQKDLIKLNYLGVDGGLKYLIETANKFGKRFWFTVQAHKWDRKNQHWLREPSAYEIKAMTNLAVCYGAKGILYYLYSNPDSDHTVLGFYYNDKNRPRYYDDYGYPKWETIKQLNHKLDSIGDELLSLSWVGAKSWSTGDTAGNWIGLISNLSTNISGETKYVETSHSTNKEIDYFFVVNRLTIPTNQRTIKVTIDKSLSIYNNWKITEVGTINSWTVRKTGNFQTVYEPGEGKLFKLEKF